MHTVNIHEAKTHLSKLLEEVAQGEEVIVAKSGKPVAMIVPFKAIKSKRKFGVLKGKVWIADDFDAPLPKDILGAFYRGDL